MDRVTLLMGATALLYLGPLLAGLGASGWPWVYGFVAVFVLWLIVMRPRDWPRSATNWQDATVLVRAVTQIAVQILLVALLFGIGRGIGGVLGLSVVWPAWLPLSISFLAVPLGRLIWDPWKAEEMERMLDQAIAAVRATPLDPGETATAQRQLDQLFALPDDAAVQEVQPLLDQITRQTAPEALSFALRDAALRPDAGRLPRLAFLLHATDGMVAERLGGDLPTRALALLSGQPALIGLWADRTLVALQEFPGLWGACPDEDMLAGFLSQTEGTPAQGALIRLRDRLRDLAPGR